MRTLINVFYVVALPTLLFSLSGCDDDDKPKFDKSNLHGRWKLTAESDKAGGVFMHLEACSMDNIFTYNSDGTYVQVEGQTKCESTDPEEIYEGRWKILNDWLILDDELHEASNSSVDKPTTMSKILVLTSTTLTLQMDVDFLGKSVTITSTYLKQ
jgi:hypothetical protein